MLAHEWRELEVLCERISDLRHRFTSAQKTQNAGLIEGLRSDLANARRQRELLVQHISARLGSAAAEHSHNGGPPSGENRETVVVRGVDAGRVAGSHENPRYPGSGSRF